MVGDHRHQRQDDHRLPGPRRSSRRRGCAAGLLGTVKQVVGGVEEEVERTTPEAIDLQRTFRRMLDAGDRACVMEVSSHALALGRADGIRFDVAAFTNLTQDHLDFHGDMEDYFAGQAAARSGRAEGGRPRRRRGGQRRRPLRRRASPPSSASRRADLTPSRRSGADGRPARRATSTSTPTGTRFRCTGRAREAARSRCRCRATSTSRTPSPRSRRPIALGLDLDAAAAALAEAEPVPGPHGAGRRGPGLRACSSTTPTRPTRSRTCSRAARRLTARAADLRLRLRRRPRSADKRPLMGAGRRRARRPRRSSPPTTRAPRTRGAIIDRSSRGRPERRARSVVVEPDRRAAIAAASLEAAAPGDLVVIAGKGHEQGQEFEDGRKIPFDDREVAREELGRLAAEPRRARDRARRRADRRRGRRRDRHPR